MKKLLFVYLGLLTISPLSQAQNLKTIEGKVVQIEPTYMPALVQFKMDTGTTKCPAGTRLKWQKSDLENNKVIYSGLLAAMTSGNGILFYYDDADTATDCLGTHIHLLKD